MKITNKDIPMIVGLIKKLSRNKKQLNTQSFYPSSKRFNNLCNKLSLRKNKGYNALNKVEKSIIHKFEVKEVAIHKRFSNDGFYININNQDQTEDGWKATVIYTDCFFTLKNNVITIVEDHPSDETKRCVTKIWFT